MSRTSSTPASQPAADTTSPADSKSAPSDLPSPADRPDALILIYDGHCRFCSSQVKRIYRWDVRSKVAFLSLHDPEVQRRYPDLTHDQLMEEMVLIDQQGNRHGGAAAFRYLTRIIPGFYPFAPIMHIPFSLPIWSWFYRQVAKHRYRFGKVEGCEGSCDIHFK